MPVGYGRSDTRQLTKGSEYHQAKDTGAKKSAKKAPQMTLKEKRAQKRAAGSEGPFIKPRKG